MVFAECRDGSSLDTVESTEPPPHLQLSLPESLTPTGTIPLINYALLDGNLTSASFDIAGSQLSYNAQATSPSELRGYEFGIGTTSDFDGNHLTLFFNNQVIPEPNTGVLLTFAGVVAVLRRSRRRIAQAARRL